MLYVHLKKKTLGTHLIFKQSVSLNIKVSLQTKVPFIKGTIFICSFRSLPEIYLKKKKNIYIYIYIYKWWVI